ncbi:hypothetical protein XPA_009903 [Xanthoria parietina]
MLGLLEMPTSDRLPLLTRVVVTPLHKHAGSSHSFLPTLLAYRRSACGMLPTLPSYLTGPRCPYAFHCHTPSKRISRPQQDLALQNPAVGEIVCASRLASFTSPVPNSRKPQVDRTTVLPWEQLIAPTLAAVVIASSALDRPEHKRRGTGGHPVFAL